MERLHLSTMEAVNAILLLTADMSLNFLLCLYSTYLHTTAKPFLIA